MFLDSVVKIIIFWMKNVKVNLMFIIKNEFIIFLKLLKIIKKVCIVKS